MRSAVMMQTLAKVRRVFSSCTRVVEYLHEAKAKRDRKRNFSSCSHLKPPDHWHGQDDNHEIYAQIDNTSG